MHTTEGDSMTTTFDEAMASVLGQSVTRTQILAKAETRGRGVAVGIRRQIAVADDGTNTVKSSLPVITLTQEGRELTVVLAPDVAADIADALDQAAHTAREETP